MKLIELRPENYTYIGKTFTRKRFISEDRKIFITQDATDYIRAYTGTGQGGKVERIYIKENEGAGHPVYTIEQAQALINNYTGQLKTIEVNPSQYK